MSKVKMNFPTLTSIVFTVTILLGIFLWFKNTTDQMVQASNEYYLKGITNAQAIGFQTKVKDLLTMLESQARFFEKADMSDIAEIESIIKHTKGIGDFKVIGVANKKGEAIDYTGKYTKNISRYDYFVSAIQGAPTVSKMTYYNKEFGEVLVFAVPIIQYGKAEGIVYGYFVKQTLSSMIESISLSSTTASLLFTLDGTILAREDRAGLISARISNFYDIATVWGLRKHQTLNDIKLKVLDGQSMVIPYKSGKNSRLSILAPVGVHDWYFAMIIPLTTITEQSNTISTHVLYVEIAVSMAFILLFVSILYLLKNNELITKTNEKYRFISSQTQTIVFDYDIEKKRLELSGNIEAILTDPQEVFTGSKISEVLARIHEDDVSFIHELKSISEITQNSINREMRFKCVNDEYYWYRLTGAIVRKEDGMPQRFIGNIINVEEEVNKEIQLKQKAEIDPLTSILNKGAFADHVEETLRNASADDMYAYYIIDLDNFKAVNDNLGHIVGDRVISEAAQKLCVIFSEKDFVGRIGGDEFAAFLNLSNDGKKIGMKIIENKANAICKKLNEIYSDGQKSVNVSASVGVSVYPQHGLSYNELYKNADSVLYESKKGGKNQYHICKNR